MAVAHVRLIMWCKSGRTRSDRDHRLVALRRQRSGSAREAGLFALGCTAGRYGARRDRATIANSGPKFEPERAGTKPRHGAMPRHAGDH
jgi:hypothetical protein